MNSDIFLWKRRTLRRFPWQRINLSEFCKYEQHQINNCFDWYYKHFLKNKIGQQLPEITFYAIPIKLSASRRATIAKKGDYNYIGLSALKNSFPLVLTMLLPEDKRLPKPNSLVRIMKAKKDVLWNPGKNNPEYIILVEEFEELEPHKIYLDVPLEKRSVFKFINENLTGDPLITSSLQPTISSAPGLINQNGGITLSMFQEQSTFTQELLTILKAIQPPEFTDIINYYPKSMIKGKWEGINKQALYQLSEKYNPGTNRFRSFITNKYQKLQDELNQKQNKTGEISIAAAIQARGSGAREILKDMIYKFHNTNITNPYNFEELKYADIDLKHAMNQFDEDLMLQIAAQRENFPQIEKDNLILRKQLNSDWEDLLERLGHTNISIITKAFAARTLQNIMKVATSIARDMQKAEVDENAIKRSYKTFLNNAESMAENPEIKRLTKIQVPQQYETKRYNAIETALQEELTIKELFEYVKTLFKDLQELQKYIDKLQSEGHLYEPKRGYYKFI